MTHRLRHRKPSNLALEPTVRPRYDDLQGKRSACRQPMRLPYNFDSLTNLDRFFDQWCDVDYRALVAGVDHEQWFVHFDFFTDLFDL